MSTSKQDWQNDITNICISYGYIRKVMLLFYGNCTDHIAYMNEILT